MADTTTVSSKDEFVQAIVTNEDLYISDDGAAEFWRIWTERRTNGTEDEVVVAIPGWFAESEFGKQRPLLFARIEYDNDEKGAILFDDARIVDVNVYENGIWDDMTMSETLTTVDQTERDEFPMDEKGQIWIPRSQMNIYERDD